MKRVFNNKSSALNTEMFILGKVVITPAAMESIPLTTVLKALARHHDCDWGDVCFEDWTSNNNALKYGNRLFSIYSTPDGQRFWIITEADRSATTVLLPSDY